MLRDAVFSYAAPYVRKTDAVHFGTKLFQKGLNDWVASQVNNSSMLEVRESTVFVLLCPEAKLWRRTCFSFCTVAAVTRNCDRRGNSNGGSRTHKNHSP